MNALSDELRNLADELGSDLYGVADAAGFLNPD
jgi:hypothetical protein